jgi:hypothetical protein
MENEMKEDQDIFKVEKALQERMRKKYEHFPINVTELDLVSIKIQIQLRIAEEYLNISEEKIKEEFSALISVFLKNFLH